MSTGNELVTLKQVDNYYKDLRKRSAPVIFNNAVGNPAVFSDGADGLPIQSLKVHLLPRQEGMGDASPENVRNLIPWNGLTVWSGGANLWDEQWEVGTINTTTGEPAQADDRIRAKNYCPCLPNTTYYVVDPTHGKNIRLFYYDQSKAYIGDSAWKDSEVTTPAEAYFFRFIVAASYGTTYNNNISINYPASITTYEPYKPIIETDIDFPSTVYGGALNVVSGMMTVEWSTKQFDGSSDENWYFVHVGESSWYRAYIIMSDAKQPNDVSALADSYKAVSFNDRSYSNKVCMFGNENESPIIFNVITELTTVESFRAYLAENPLTIAHKLATPIEIQLTPAQLQSLLGNNTIWSDANGDVEVEYRADTEKFVEKSIANLPIATKTKLGVIKVPGNTGLYVVESSGVIATDKASLTGIKAGTSAYNPVVPELQHASAFYGLAKVAGVDMANSSNPVGQFTDEAKIAIKEMLGIYDAPFRLINEITVQEDCSYVNIDTDSYGLPFDLHEIVVKIITKQTNGTGNGSIVINSIAANSDSPYLSLYNSFRDNGDHIAYAHAWIAGKRFFGEAPQSTMTQAYSPTVIVRNPNASGILEAESITSITYKSLNAYLVKAGSIITLYGR